MARSKPYSSDHPIIDLAVDVVALTLAAGELQVLTVTRRLEPHGTALPGGFVGIDEDLDDAANRELLEETSVGHAQFPLEQLRTYGHPKRDPRKRVVSVAYLMVLPEPVQPRAGTDASQARWQPVSGLRGLQFDHDDILADGVERLSSKLEYTALATAFLPREFTLAQLRGVYESVWQRPLEPGNFQRKLRGRGSFVTEVGDRVPPPGGRGRPAQLFRATKGPLEVLESPMTRGSLRLGTHRRPG